jgi:hypothetical protein
MFANATPTTLDLSALAISKFPVEIAHLKHTSLTPSLDKLWVSSLHGMPTGSVCRLSQKAQTDIFIERGLKTFRHSCQRLVFSEQAGNFLLSFLLKDWAEVRVVGAATGIWLALAGSALSKILFVEIKDLKKALTNPDVLLEAGSMETIGVMLKELPTSKPVILFTSVE